MKTPEERCRAAMAILSEMVADTRVPHGLRRLATSWCQLYQDAVRESRKPDPIRQPQPRQGEA